MRSQGSTYQNVTAENEKILSGKEGVLPMIHKWRVRHIPEHVYMVSLSIIVGIIVGIATNFFRNAIGEVASFFTGYISDSKMNWWLLFVPVAGILITGIFTRYVVRTNLTHGVAQLIQNIRNKVFHIRGNVTFSPIVGGIITLGMGGSSGSEGPIAYAGAAIGSNMGSILGLDSRQTKILIGCGAGAAICGIYMSPVGGMMFALELLMIPLTTIAVINVMVACIVSYATIYLWRGSLFDYAYSPLQHFDNSQIPYVIGLALFCGLYCVYYSSVMNKMDIMFKKLKNPWISNITGGLMVGVCLLLFPSMYGVGYPVIGQIIHEHTDVISSGTLFSSLNGSGNGVLIAATAILLLKCWAVGATNDSGGVGGDFSPTLFAGAMAGFLYAGLCNTLFGCDLPISVYAFLGMAGVMSAAIEAPLMTIFIVMDLGQSYTYAVPICLCALLSFLTVKGGFRLLGKEHKMVRHLHFIH